MKCDTVFTSIAFFAILSSTVDADGDVTFVVRTKQRKDSQDFKNPLDHSKIDPALPFKFIIHGWVDWGNTSWIQNLSYAFLERGDYNVIAVNWHNLADQDYLASAKATRQVGKAIAKEIVRLRDEKGVPFRNVHIIGHSLGAHTAGFAGKEVIKSTGNKVFWITGLDPAGPLFEVPPRDKTHRLSDQDAIYVEAMHTDGGILGFIKPLAGCDFFPNGGRFIQPSCNQNLRDAIECSHMLSTKIYTDAVRVGGVTATKCFSWDAYQAGQCQGNEKAKYGAEIPPKQKGNFYNIVK